MALHPGVKTLRVKAEPLGSIGLCREAVLRPEGPGKPSEGRVGRGSRRIVDLGRSSVGWNACLGRTAHLTPTTLYYF